MPEEQNYNLDADQILSAVESGQDPATLSAESTQTSSTQQPQFKEFHWKGNTVRASDEDLLKWAPMGYDYSQNMQEFNAKQKAFDEKYKRFNEIENYVQQDPSWWEHVESQWAARTAQNQEIDPQFSKVVEPIAKELGEVKKFISSYQQKQLEEQAKQEDERLDQEIKSVQTKFPDVDFNAKDESGQSLELRVINHATKNGISSFKTAFFDYYQDNLAKVYESRGRSAIESDLKKRRAMGLLGETQAPTKDSTPVRSNSWGDAHANALKELGLTA